MMGSWLHTKVLVTLFQLNVTCRNGSHGLEKRVSRKVKYCLCGSLSMADQIVGGSNCILVPNPLSAFRKFETWYTKRLTSTVKQSMRNLGLAFMRITRLSLLTAVVLRRWVWAGSSRGKDYWGIVSSLFFAWNFSLIFARTLLSSTSTLHDSENLQLCLFYVISWTLRC